MVTVTLVVDRGPRGEMEVEMPSATTVKYAIKRIAEAIGVEPDMAGLRLAGSDMHLLEDSDDVHNLDGKRVTLLRIQEDRS